MNTIEKTTIPEDGMSPDVREENLGKVSGGAPNPFTIPPAPVDKCDICGYAFSNRVDYELHMSRVHGK